METSTRDAIRLLGISVLFASPVCAQLIPGTEGLGAAMPKNELPAAKGGTGAWQDANGRFTNILDVQALASAGSKSTTDGMLGVTRDAIKGHYYVSARRAPRLSTVTHKIHEFDENGKWLRQFDQPPGAQRSSWGIRDMAVGAGNQSSYIFGSCESTASYFTVYAYDVVAGKWDSAADWRSPPNFGPTPIGTVRALAFDPKGNNGAGSMFTADFSSSIVEFAKNGAILRVAPVGQNGIPKDHLAYGAAYDPVNETIWFFGQSGYGNGNNAAAGFEIDPRGATLVGTGSVFFAEQDVAATTGNPAVAQRGGLAGGCEFYTRSGKSADPKNPRINKAPILVCLHQATSDSISEVYGRFEHRRSTGGNVRMSGNGFYLKNRRLTLGLQNSKAAQAALYVSLGNLDLSLAKVAAGLFANGSRLLINPNSAVFLSLTGGFRKVVGGKVSVSLPVPSDPALGGVGVFFQWVEDIPNGKPTTSTGGWVSVADGN